MPLFVDGPIRGTGYETGLRNGCALNLWSGMYMDV